MIRYRPFRNTDPPALAEIWNAQPPSRGRAQPISVDWLETQVFAKPYFDREGLIVAVDEARPVGFAHASFGAADEARWYCTQLGVVSMVMVHPGRWSSDVGATLLGHAEDYLRRRGAQVLYGGGIRPLNGFYLGLYGGSELPGVLDTDHWLQQLFQSRGYREIDRTLVFQRPLDGFRAPIDRRQVQIRRRTKVQAVIDPPPATWWDACTIGAFDRTQFTLNQRDGGPVMASATYWDMRPLADAWGRSAAGLFELHVAPKHRRQGLATFLLSDSFRQLHEAQVTLVEAQTMQRNTAAAGMYRKLGFEVVDQAAVYRKEEG